MAKVVASQPFEVFTGTDGQPLENGYIYIGVENSNPETDPQTVYWDSDLTVTATQPIRTVGGMPFRNGSPGKIYIVANYSITVRDKTGALAYSSLSETVTTTVSQWLDPDFSVARVSNTQFTISGDQTSEFEQNRRVRFVDPAGTKYGTITTSSYSAPLTTVTIVVDAGGTIDAGMSEVSLGMLTASNTSTVVLDEDDMASNSALLPASQQSTKSYVDASMPRGYISGLLFSNDGTDAVNDFQISAGECRASDDSGNFSLASAQIKKMDATWATGTNAGAITATAWGATGWAANTTYHVFAATISGVNEIIVDTDVGGANITTDHSPTLLRHIFSFKSGATPNVPAIHTKEVGADVWVTHDVMIQEVSNTGSTTAVSLALTAPAGVQLLARVGVYLSNASSASALITETAQTDTAPSAGALDCSVNASSTLATVKKTLMTDTSAQIRYRTSATVTLFIILSEGYTFIRS